MWLNVLRSAATAAAEELCTFIPWQMGSRFAREDQGVSWEEIGMVQARDDGALEKHTGSEGSGT